MIKGMEYSRKDKNRQEHLGIASLNFGWSE